MLRSILISICGRLPLSPFFPKGTINAARQWGTPHLFGTFPRTGTDLVVSSHMFKVAPRLHYQKAQNSPCHTFYSLVGVRTSGHVAQQTHSISLFLTGNQRIKIVESLSRWWLSLYLRSFTPKQTFLQTLIIRCCWLIVCDVP